MSCCASIQLLSNDCSDIDTYMIIYYDIHHESIFNFVSFWVFFFIFSPDAIMIFCIYKKLEYTKTARFKIYTVDRIAVCGIQHKHAGNVRDN